MAHHKSTTRRILGGCLTALLLLGLTLPGAEAAGRARLRVLDLNLKTRVGTATIQYLRILGGVDTGVRKGLNTLFRKQALEKQEEEKTSFAETPEVLQNMKDRGWGPGSMERTVKVTRNRGGILSFTLTDSEYVPGMAHPNPGFGALTVDLATGETVRAEQVFLPQAAWRPAVDREVRRQFQASGKTLLPEVPFPAPEAYEKNFYLTDKPKRGVVFYWSYYDFTPYSEGLSTFFVPFDLLGDAVAPRFR